MGGSSSSSHCDEITSHNIIALCMLEAKQSNSWNHNFRRPSGGQFALTQFLANGSAGRSVIAPITFDEYNIANLKSSFHLITQVG
jgi:hypothetical protein